MIYYIIGIIVLYLIFIIFIYLLKIKINKLEQKIIQKFKEKTNIIPSIHDITKEYISKHDETFEEILNLKKQDFTENEIYSNILEKANTYKKIHNELNFIFKVCNQNKKLLKNHKFLYIREYIIDLSSDIGQKLDLYKKIVKKYNNFINIKNLTIIGIFIPIGKIKLI